MKAAEYISRVIAELASDAHMEKTSYDGAFLTAALDIIREVESPMKEDALVQLAIIEKSFRARQALCGRQVA
jgi:hypothetical protein